MLFPLDPHFNGCRIFQKCGDHSEAPKHRVWTVDHTGSADRIKELHLLLTDQKPYKCHERLATKKAVQGQKADASRMNSWMRDLGDMGTRIDAEAEERRQETIRQIRTLNKRNAGSEADLRNLLKTQAQDHRAFLNDMDVRVGAMPYIWVGEPIRETAERTRARSDASKGVVQATKDYKQSITNLTAELAERGPQEWTDVPRFSNDTIVARRKAKGLAILKQHQADYETGCEQVLENEQQRALHERAILRKEGREAERRLCADKTKLLTAMNEMHSAKRAELDGIQARVNGRGSGHPAHEEFIGYATAGYAPVHKSSSRVRDQNAERADRDADHAEGAAKLLCLSMPLPTRNRIVANNPPKLASSLNGTLIQNPMDWTAMNWTQKWSLLSKHGPPSAVQKAQSKAGVDASGMDMSQTVSGISASEQRTLSPRTLGMATTS